MSRDSLGMREWPSLTNTFHQLQLMKAVVRGGLGNRANWYTDQTRGSVWAGSMCNNAWSTLHPKEWYNYTYMCVSDVIWPSHLEVDVKGRKLAYTVHFTSYKAVARSRRQSCERKLHHVTSGDRKSPASDVLLPEVSWKWILKTEHASTVHFTTYKAVPHSRRSRVTGNHIMWHRWTTVAWKWRHLLEVTWKWM